MSRILNITHPASGQTFHDPESGMPIAVLDYTSARVMDGKELVADFKIARHALLFCSAVANATNNPHVRADDDDRWPMRIEPAESGWSVSQVDGVAAVAWFAVEEDAELFATFVGSDEA